MVLNILLEQRLSAIQEQFVKNNAFPSMMEVKIICKYHGEQKPTQTLTLGFRSNWWPNPKPIPNH